MAATPRSAVTLVGGRRIEVAIAAERLAELLAVGAPGRIGVRDEREPSWVWVEVEQVAGVEPIDTPPPG